jgi:hypothetical protein
MNSSEFEKNKNLIENTIKQECYTIEYYLSQIGICEENLSKSLRSELNEFVCYIKFNKELFLHEEQENFYYIENIEKNNYFPQDCCDANLNLLKSCLQNLNLKLKIENEKLNTPQPVDYSNKNSQDLTLNFIQNKLENIIINKNTKNQFEYPKLSNFILEKNKTEEMKLQNLNLKKRKKELENKINKYCNLPTDLKKIKEMINLKIIELEKLKHNN